MRIARVRRPWVSPLWQGYPQRRDHIARVLTNLGHTILDVDIAPARTPWVGLSYAVGMVRALPRVASIDADVLLAEDMESALVAAAGNALARRPFVFDFIDDYAAITRDDGLRHAAVRLLEKSIPRIADAVIVADETKRAFCAGLGVETSVIENGVDPAMFSPGDIDAAFAARHGILRAPGRGVVLFVGKLNRYYNLEVLIDAVATLADTQLVLVGEGNHEPALRARAEATGAQVRFVGSLPHDEIPTAIRLADVCILPLPAQSALSLYEYLACAKPVVVPRGGTAKMRISAALADNCLVSVEDTAAGFADGIRELLADPVRARTLGARGRAAVLRDHTWDSLGGAYAAVLARAAGHTL